MFLVEAVVVHVLVVVVPQEEGLREEHDGDADDGDDGEYNLKDVLVVEESGFGRGKSRRKEHIDDNGQDGWRRVGSPISDPFDDDENAHVPEDAPKEDDLGNELEEGVDLVSVALAAGFEDAPYADFGAEVAVLVVPLPDFFPTQERQ